MWSNAAAGSACSPGARGTGKRRDFSTFTEGDAEDSDWAPLPGLHPCDYGSQCLAALGPGTFQPMLHCNMTCSRTGQRCSGRYHACCVTHQETQDSSSVLPPNACGLPKCVLVNKIGGPGSSPRTGSYVSGSSPRTGSYVDHQPKKAVQRMQETTRRRARGSAAQPPPKGSAQYAAILRRAAVFALEINTNLEGQDGREHEGRGSERGPHGEQRTDDDARAALPPGARGCVYVCVSQTCEAREGRVAGALQRGAGKTRHARSCLYTQTFRRGKWKRVY